MDSTSDPTPTVFVVDDDEPVRSSLKILLELRGFAVEEFASIAAFLNRYRHPRRGCLILDHDLPVMTGINFLESAAGKNLSIPVIFITGDSDPHLERRALEAGAAAFLEKPIPVELLLSKVKAVTAHH
jgi:two-component system response regulator FixJ